MARSRGSRDHNIRSQAAYAFQQRGLDIVKVAADLITSDGVQPKEKLEFISKLLPYMFTKRAPVRQNNSEDGDEPADEPVLSREQILAELDRIKGDAN